MAWIFTLSDHISSGRENVTIRAGIIGAGWVGTARHLPALQRATGVELVAIYDRTVERAREHATEGVLATDDLDAFFDQGLDLVAICTSPWSHAEYTHMALGHGAHVFCEKPMTLELAEAEGMVAAAQAADRILCVSHNFLWSDAMIKARRLLAEAGDLRYVSGLQLSSEERRLPTWYQDLPGGLLFDEIPHMLYILDDILGSDLVVEDVRADWAGRDSEPQSCDVRLRGNLGPAQLTMVFSSPISEWHVTSVAERNVVDVDLFRDVVIATGSDGAHLAKDVLGTSARVAGQHLLGFAQAGLRLARKRQYWGHDRLVQEVVDAIAEGRPSPVPGSNALSVVRSTDAIIAGLTS